MIYLLGKKGRLISSFFLILFCSQLVACSQYHRQLIKNRDLQGLTTSEIKYYINNNADYAYFIHKGDEIIQVDKIEMDRRNKYEITADVTTLSSDHLALYERIIENPKLELDPISDLNFIHQVHIYVKDYEQDGNQILLKDGKIEKCEIYNNEPMSDGVRTAVIIIIVILVAIPLLFLIFLLIVCNCPHVYINNGDALEFNNTMFTGAVDASLERHDYKELPDYFRENSDYSIEIRNEENEIQYINLAELIVITHDKDIRVLADQEGSFYALGNSYVPLTATSDDGTEVADLLKEDDGDSYTFNTSGETLSNLTARFHLPEENRDELKLVLNVKNTIWSGFVYNEFTNLFGHKLDEWKDAHKDKSREDREKEMQEQGITLAVEILEGDEWVHIDNIDLIGEANFNQIVVPIDKQYGQKGDIQIRLKSGFMFWEVNNMYIDNTPQQKLHIKKISPMSNNQLLQDLAKNDDAYSELHNGDVVKVNYEGLEVNADKNRSIFLHSKGYYLSTEKGEGKVRYVKLNSMNKPGGLSDFSNSLYNDQLKGYAYIEK